MQTVAPLTPAVVHALDRVLNEKELAAYLGIAPMSLLRMRAAGTGPKFLQLGARRIAYRFSSVQAWLDGQERTTGKCGNRSPSEP